MNQYPNQGPVCGAVCTIVPPWLSWVAATTIATMFPGPAERRFSILALCLQGLRAEPESSLAAGNRRFRPEAGEVAHDAPLRSEQSGGKLFASGCVLLGTIPSA